MTSNKAILLNDCLILQFPDCPFLGDSRNQWVQHCSDLTAKPQLTNQRCFSKPGNLMYFGISCEQKYINVINGTECECDLVTPLLRDSKPHGQLSCTR